MKNLEKGYEKMKEMRALAKGKKKRLGNMNQARDTFELSLLVLPGLILVILFNYWPMFGVIMAFKNFNMNLGILGSEWVGFDNFKFFLTSNDFIRVFRNTVLYGLDFLLLGNAVNVFFAVLLYNVRRRAA